MAGLLCKINPKMPIFVNLVIAQLFGRAVRAVAVLIAVYVIGLNNPAPTAVASIWEAVVAGLPGIVLQWALIPLIVYRAKGMKQKPLA